MTPPTENDLLPLTRAAHAGDIDAVRRLIAEGVEINKRDPNLLNGTALEIALQRRDGAMMRLLLQAGANPSEPDGEWKTSCVMKAVAQGYIECVKLLVDEFGHALANPYVPGPAGVLTVAAGHGDRDAEGALAMLRYLVEERGLDPAQPGAGDLTAATIANSPRMPAALLEYLYSKGAVSFGTQDAEGFLSAAPSSGTNQTVFDDAEKGEAVRPLFEPLEHLNDTLRFIDRFTKKSTLLNQSVYDADAEKVRIHLKHGASALVGDAGGVTPYDLLELLKQRGEYKPEHDAVKAALDESVAAQKQRRRPKMPQP